MITLSGCVAGAQEVARLDTITPRLATKDPSIWGPAAEKEAAIRLDWVDLPNASRGLLPILDSLSAWSREMNHREFILCGMGGSSLAPEVIAKCFNTPLTVLDTTDPEQINTSLPKKLQEACIIIGSKSGSTIETASQKSFFMKRLSDDGLDPRDHMVIITDPQSPLDIEARGEGLKVVNANPHVGGRFSALSAFGLTPAALIGVDVSVLLDDAELAAREFTKPGSVVAQMASFLKEYRYVGFCDQSSPIPGISDWIEQLVAESTGKDGRGVLPVVVDKKSVSSNLYPTIGFDASHSHSVQGPLGAQFIFWEWVTALLCYLLEVDPFNQPNVAESKERTGAILDHWDAQSTAQQPRLSFGALDIFSNFEASSLADYLENLRPHQDGYLAIMAYLNRLEDREVADLRNTLEEAFDIPVTFGWGPRFLHSTGQFHKGGPLVGTFLQITGGTRSGLEIPGREFGFDRLVMAQALGDYEALVTRELRVLRIHLRDRKQGVEELLRAVKDL